MRLSLALCLVAYCVSSCSAFIAKTSPRSCESSSDYDATSTPVKALVSTLTEVFNLGAQIAPQKQLQQPQTDSLIQNKRRRLTPRTLQAGIREDYEQAYLWTGRINPSLYNPDCVFTDPTLSFKGLATFQKNVASLRPLVARFVPRYGVDLLSCEAKQVHMYTCH